VNEHDSSAICALCQRAHGRRCFVGLLCQFRLVSVAVAVAVVVVYVFVVVVVVLLLLLLSLLINVVVLLLLLADVIFF